MFFLIIYRGGVAPRGIARDGSSLEVPMQLAPEDALLKIKEHS